MSDFYQHRLVTTLHQLADPSFNDQQEQLKQYAKDKPITLVMPALYSEVEGPALPGILEHLEEVEFINEVVISMNRMDSDQFKKAKDFFSKLPQKHFIIWNDGPRVSDIYNELKEAQITEYIPGKGCNVWMAYGFILARGNAGIIAMHDSDILSYHREMLARLCMPTAHPGLEYDYCKSYYGRVSDRMYGRVTRLFVIPLLRALIKVYGNLRMLDYLEGFRYPLSGEFSISTDLARRVGMPGDWGLEVGMLVEVYHNTTVKGICQVDLGSNFEHKHQHLGHQHDDPEPTVDKGLMKMAREIALSLFSSITSEGVVMDSGSLKALRLTYERTAKELIQRYHDDSTVNGLKYYRHEEAEAVEAFSSSLNNAIQVFTTEGYKARQIPNWNRTFSAVPDLADRLKEAIGADNE
ncbi:MAG: glycosyl transferase [Verrucomicrobiota bacterium]|nr:glycosyl transferase [Verrucomicrobiota bacterium]